MPVSPNPNDIDDCVWFPPASARTHPIYSAWTADEARTYHHEHRCPAIIDSDGPDDVERVSPDDERLAEADAKPCDECVTEDEGAVAGVMP